MKAKIKLIVTVLCVFSFLFIGIFEVIAKPPKPPRKTLPPHKKPRILKHRFLPAPMVKRPARPGPEHMWIPRYKHPSGVFIGGFWRPPHKKGFLWVEGYWNDDGEWVFGYWKPKKKKKGHVWVPGYWDSQVWIKGYWRPVNKTGFKWLPGHFNNKGIWIKGHWKKL